MFVTSTKKARGRVAATLVALLVCLAVPAGASAAAGKRSAAAPADAPRAHRVDVNTAGVEELQTLPRIGPALARRIVEYRRKAGPFRRVEDLLAVRGIGPKLLERLRGKIAIGRGPASPGEGTPR